MMTELESSSTGQRLGGWAQLGVGTGEERAAADGLHDETDGRDIGHISGVRGAATTGEETADPSSAIDNHRARVALVREGARLVVKGQNRPLFGNPRDIAKVGTSVGQDVVGAPNGQAGGPATLEDHDATFVIHSWTTHLLVCGGTPKTQEAVA